MSRFADSPYFLLKDYMKAVVAPPNPEFLLPDIVNFNEQTLFADIIWVGGVTNVVTSSPYTDSLSQYPSYDSATIFEHDDTQWNGWFDRSPTVTYHLDNPDGVGVLMRGMEKSIVVDGGQYVNLYAKTANGFAPIRLKPLYEDPVDKQFFRFDEVEIQTLLTDAENPESPKDLYNSDNGACSVAGVNTCTVARCCSDSQYKYQYECEQNAGTWYTDRTDVNGLTQSICEANGGTWLVDGNSVKSICEDNGGVWTSTVDGEYDELGDTGVGYGFDSINVNIETYQYGYNNEFGDGIELAPGTEIYIRKDSNFHGWLINEDFAKAIYKDEFDVDFITRNYVNTDKLFLYFGKVYRSPKDNDYDPNRWQIEFNGLKDWIQRALPANNRKELFIEFLDTYFDMVYSEGYQQLKDIWSLRDAMECNKTFLAYIPTFYNMPRYDDIPDWFADIYREYARDLVWLLKRKGTYASMYIIYDLFCNNSDNIFNVMERWHDDDGLPIITDYTDHTYVGQYGEVVLPDKGAGDFWYQKLIGDGVQANYTPQIPRIDEYWADINNPDTGGGLNIRIDGDELWFLADTYDDNDARVNIVFELEVFNTTLLSVHNGRSGYTLEPGTEDSILDPANYRGSLFDFDNAVTWTWANNGFNMTFDVTTGLDEFYFNLAQPITDDVVFRVKIISSVNNSGGDIVLSVGNEVLESVANLADSAEYWFSSGGISQINPLPTPLVEYPDDYVSSRGQRLSPHYRVDLDLSVEPLNNLKIMPKQIADNLYTNWETMRPVNRQVEYNLLFAPTCDLTGQIFTMYPSPNATQAQTSAQKNATFDADNFIKFFRDVSSAWIVEHNLNTEDIIVTVWDKNFEKMLPGEIQILGPNSVQITHSVATVGLALVTKAKASDARYDNTLWSIIHGYSQEEILLQFRNTDTNKVEYPQRVRVRDTQRIDVTGLDPDEDYKIYLKRGLTDGESIDEGGTALGAEIWSFPHAKYNITDGLWYWTIEHDYPESIFMVNCYGNNNFLLQPLSIAVNDDASPPTLVIAFNEDVTGFAAIKHIGDAVAFEGILPRDVDGNLKSLEWRLTVETDEGLVNTSLIQDTSDTERFANYNKDNITYWDGVNSNKTFSHGRTDLQEEDNEWAYYTFTVTNETLRQLNIKEYDIIGIELANTGITRSDKQRVVYSKISGIYKPDGVNFVGHFKIYKNLLGINAILLDHLYENLLDHLGNPLYSN